MTDGTKEGGDGDGEYGLYYTGLVKWLTHPDPQRPGSSANRHEMMAAFKLQALRIFSDSSLFH